MQGIWARTDAFQQDKKVDARHLHLHTRCTLPAHSCLHLSAPPYARALRTPLAPRALLRRRPCDDPRHAPPAADHAANSGPGQAHHQPTDVQVPSPSPSPSPSPNPSPSPSPSLALVLTLGLTTAIAIALTLALTLALAPLKIPPPQVLSPLAPRPPSSANSPPPPTHTHVARILPY